MRILVHEFVTGGGWYSIHPTELAPASLQREAEFMVRQTCRSLLDVPGIEIAVLLDNRISPMFHFAGSRLVIHPAYNRARYWELFSKLTSDVDGTVVIAPEFRNLLQDHVTEVVCNGGSLLGPTRDFVALATYKIATLRCLRAEGVRVPNGIMLKCDEALPGGLAYPAVIKPVDGCGSLGVRKVKGPMDPVLDWAWRLECGDADLHLEDFIPGQPASVGAIAGSNETVLLPPFFQWIDEQKNFAYRGGALIEDTNLTERAHRLARQSLAALPPALGYVGFDIIFGDAADGSQDYVIEVNPRFTTSFAALMAHVAGPEYSLMGALIDLIEGRPAKIAWKNGPLRFSVDEFDV